MNLNRCDFHIVRFAGPTVAKARRRARLVSAVFALIGVIGALPLGLNLAFPGLLPEPVVAFGRAIASTGISGSILAGAFLFLGGIHPARESAALAKDRLVKKILNQPFSVTHGTGVVWLSCPEEQYVDGVGAKHLEFTAAEFAEFTDYLARNDTGVLAKVQSAPIGNSLL